MKQIPERLKKIKHKWWLMRLYSRITGRSEHFTPNSIGAKQFWDDESTGVKPDNPDPYYTHLCHGKGMVAPTQDAYRNAFLGLDRDGNPITMQTFGYPWAGTLCYALEMGEKLFNFYIPFLPYPHNEVRQMHLANKEERKNDV